MRESERRRFSASSSFSVNINILAYLFVIFMMRSIFILLTLYISQQQQQRLSRQDTGFFGCLLLDDAIPWSKRAHNIYVTCVIIMIIVNSNHMSFDFILLLAV